MLQCAVTHHRRINGRRYRYCTIVKDLRRKTDRSMGILWKIDVLWKASGMFSGHFIILFLKWLSLSEIEWTQSISFLSSSIYLKGIIDIISFNRLAARKNILTKRKKTRHLILTSDSVVCSSLSALFSLKLHFLMNILLKRIYLYLEVLLLFSARFFSCLLTAIAL